MVLGSVQLTRHNYDSGFMTVFVIEIASIKSYRLLHEKCHLERYKDESG